MTQEGRNLVVAVMIIVVATLGFLGIASTFSSPSQQIERTQEVRVVPMEGANICINGSCNHISDNSKECWRLYDTRRREICVTLEDVTDE